MLGVFVCHIMLLKMACAHNFSLLYTMVGRQSTVKYMWLNIVELYDCVGPNHKYNTFRSVLLFRDPWAMRRKKSISQMENELDPGILMFYRCLISHKYIILMIDYYQQIKASIFNRSEHLIRCRLLLLLFFAYSSQLLVY